MGKLIRKSKVKRHGNKILDTALKYAKNGFRVFPVHSPVGRGCSCGNANCTSNGKHPRITDWQNKATSDPEEIRNYWNKWPDANIGVLTGANLVVLDIDFKHGGEESLNSLSEKIKGLLETVVVETGNGLHLYFSSTQAFSNSVGDIGPGIDVRADRGYVVGVSSLHANGKQYSFKKNRQLKFSAIAPLPPELCRLIKKTNGEKNSKRATASAILHSGRKGTRNVTATSLAGVLFRERIDPYLVCELVHSWNITHNSPPLPESEISIALDSIAKKEISRRLGEGK